jgi:hypothetical protein
MYVIKDELDHYVENFAKIIQIFFLETSDPNLNPVQVFRIRIRPDQKGPDPPGSISNLS